MNQAVRLEKTLLKIAFGLSVLALFSAILIWPTILRPFILGKMLPFQTFVLLLVVVWIGLMIIDFQKYRPRFNLLTIAVTIFFGAILLSCIFSWHPYRSFWGNAERMEGFISLIHFYFFFLALSSLFHHDKEYIRKLVFSSICINFFGVIFPILEWLRVMPLPRGESLARPGGVFGNPTFFAGFILVHLFLMVWYYLTYAKKEEFKSQRTWLIIMGLVSLVVFLWVQTRGSIIGLIVGLFAALIVSIFTIPNKIYKKFAMIGAGVIVLMGILFFVFQPQIQQSRISQEIPFVGRLASISLSDASTRARILNWQRSFNWWKERPIFGYGQDMFYQVFDKNYSGDDFALSRERFDRAHNKFFDVLLMNGAVGFLAYLFLLGVVGYLIILKIKKCQTINDRFAWISIFGLFIAYLVHNFFVFDTPANSIFFYFFLAFLNIETWDLQKRKMLSEEKKVADSKRVPIKSSITAAKFGSTQILILIIALLGASFVFYHVDAKPFKAASLMYQANQIRPNQVKDVFAVFQKAVNYNTFLNTEIKKPWADYFHSYLVYVQQGKIEANKEDVVWAYEQIKDNLLSGYAHEPMIDFYVYLANIAIRMSDLSLFSSEEQADYWEEAEAFFEFIATNWPKRTDLYINAAFFAPDDATRQKWLDRIIASTPKYAPALWLKGVSLIKQEGDAQEIYDMLSRALDNDYQFVFSNNSDFIFSAQDQLVNLKKEGKLLQLIDQGIIEEEKILANQKLNAFEKNLHTQKLKSLVDLGILMEIINPNPTNEDLEHLITYLDKADALQKNRIEVLVKYAAAYAQLHNKEKAIEYASKVKEIDSRYATDVEVFIKIVEEEKWDQL
ncbi:MAG: O-antigen ligase [Candidatus Paceibacterota bacterium]